MAAKKGLFNGKKAAPLTAGTGPKTAKGTMSKSGAMPAGVMPVSAMPKGVMPSHTTRLGHTGMKTTK